jgi:hypothetical protein
VRRDELLLLAKRIEEAEGVRAEANHSDEREQQERATGARRHPRTLSPCRRGEQHEGEHQPGGGLHADAGNEQGGSRGEVGILTRSAARSTTRAAARPCPRARPRFAIRAFARGERQRAREHEQHERVVVRATHRQLE